ncbi:hypothetical protein ACFQPF_16515 [Fictibacillus iocasae]|uniref:Transcriptional regulator n=1 Tax=Fictibacillus iocasae TaxID=2715437 RepID=A0ABW2NX85_9BACL
MGEKQLYLSRLGLWMENHNLQSDWLAYQSGVKKSTIDMLARTGYKKPNMLVMRKIYSELKKIDHTIKLSDFWDVQTIK